MDERKLNEKTERKNVTKKTAEVEFLPKPAKFECRPKNLTKKLNEKKLYEIILTKKNPLNLFGIHVITQKVLRFDKFSFGLLPLQAACLDKKIIFVF